MSWFISHSTTLTFGCNHPECTNEIDYADEGPASHGEFCEGLMDTAKDEGWIFLDEDGDECYCPEHAAEIEKESQP